MMEELFAKADAKEKAAIKAFGVTNNPKFAGYLTRSGKMLNFYSGYGGQRDMDHREIAEVFLPEELENEPGGNCDGMNQFIAMGNIRLLPYGLDIGRKPTEMQWGVIKVIKMGLEALYIDFSDRKGRPIGAVELSRFTPIGEIRRVVNGFWETGVVPESEYAL